MIPALLRHRDVARLKTVVDSLIPMVDSAGRIHTTFNQMIAATGRLSSTDPNLQNIPVRTAEGRQIRQAFIVGADYESLLTADYSQIEMRIMAHLSHDEGLIEAFTSGEDLHTWVASRVHELDPEDVDPELRRRIKAMSYGLAYGLSDFGLAAQLGIPRDEAREQMDAYFARFGGVRGYLRSVVAEARGNGYTETILGRRRYLPDLTSDNGQRRAMAERMALNAPIQGSAADIIKIAMLGVHRALRDAEAALPAAAAGARRAGAGDLPGRAGRGRGNRAARDGRRVSDGRAARRVRRLRAHLGRRRPLTSVYSLDRSTGVGASCTAAERLDRLDRLDRLGPGRRDRGIEAGAGDVAARPAHQNVRHDEACGQPRDRRDAVERLHPLTRLRQVVPGLHFEDVSGTGRQRRDASRSAAGGARAGPAARAMVMASTTRPATGVMSANASPAEIRTAIAPRTMGTRPASLASGEMSTGAASDPGIGSLSGPIRSRTGSRRSTISRQRSSATAEIPMPDPDPVLRGPVQRHVERRRRRV